jgi:hypothetical protein
MANVIMQQLKDARGYFDSLSACRSITEAQLAESRGHMAERIVAQILALGTMTMPDAARLNESILSSPFNTDATRTSDLLGAVRRCVESTTPLGKPIRGGGKQEPTTQTWQFPNTYLTAGLASMFASKDYTWEQKVTLTAKFLVALGVPNPSNDTLGYALVPIVQLHFGGSLNMNPLVRYELCEFLRTELHSQRKLNPQTVEIWLWPAQPSDLPQGIYDKLYSTDPPVQVELGDMHAAANAIIKRSTNVEYKKAKADRDQRLGLAVTPPSHQRPSFGTPCAGANSNALSIMDGSSGAPLVALMDRLERMNGEILALRQSTIPPPQQQQQPPQSEPQPQQQESPQLAERSVPPTLPAAAPQSRIDIVASGLGAAVLGAGTPEQATPKRKVAAVSASSLASDTVKLPVPPAAAPSPLALADLPVPPAPGANASAVDDVRELEVLVFIQTFLYKYSRPTSMVVGSVYHNKQTLRVRHVYHNS